MASTGVRPRSAASPARTFHAWTARAAVPWTGRPPRAVTTWARMPRLSQASTDVSLTSTTSVLTCPDSGSSVVISCLVHYGVQGGDDARASGDGSRLGDPIVDGAGGRRRAGRPGRPVPGLSHRHRPVAERGQSLRVRSQELLGV